ncbi:MAG: YdcH family protein, partial [Bdellovibrionales bacterium]|nr:YdcH family protein [Bdellovibrionales bacterium]
RLYDEHLEIEDRLRRFERFPAYTSNASLLERELKKRKLRGMDTIMRILQTHREEIPHNGAGMAAHAG